MTTGRINQIAIFCVFGENGLGDRVLFLARQNPFGMDFFVVFVHLESQPFLHKDPNGLVV